MAERTVPYRFVLSGVSINVIDSDSGEETWAAEARWYEEDGSFCLDCEVGNYAFAPVDLEELARILRSMPRELVTGS